MSARTVQETRSNAWPTSSVVCSAQSAASITTADPMLSLVTAPMPTLVIRFGSSPTPLVLAPAASPAPRVERPYGHAQPRPEAPPPAPQTPRLQPAATPETAPRGEPQHLVAPPELALPAEPLAAAPGEPPPAADASGHDASVPAMVDEKPPARSNRIELIIDSLPHHQLTEPIPVTIDPLGDEMFTASMRDLDIAATGNSIGEALLFLKEHIESNFDDLSRRLSQLTPEQKTMLQLLHTYIPPAHQPRRWF